MGIERRGMERKRGVVDFVEEGGSEEGERRKGGDVVDVREGKSGRYCGVKSVRGCSRRCERDERVVGVHLRLRERASNSVGGACPSREGKNWICL